MKYIIASDIHGSLFYTKLLMEHFNQLQADKLILLGDILYHGPRNPLPLEYNPKEVSNLLNEYRSKIIWIKGNCDSEVDQMVLNFQAVNEAVLVINNRNIYLSHGHIINEDNNLLLDRDILISGHTHIQVCKEVNNITYLNPGSTSLPKEDSKNAFILLDENKLTCLSFNMEVLYEIKL